jgi:uncharacterized protein YeaO (DUF488 family)
MSKLAAKRVYDPRDDKDGQRVLVDRIWPRGIRKAELGDALWVKDIAPSTALRQWFAHRPERWKEFCKRYWAELDRSKEPVETLRGLVRKHKVTLLYSAHDTEHNQAVALLAYLQRRD